MTSNPRCPRPSPSGKGVPSLQARGVAYPGLGQVTYGEEAGLVGQAAGWRAGVGGKPDLAWGSPRALTFRGEWPRGVGSQQHMCVRVPGILAAEKVAMVTRVAPGTLGQAGVLHAVDAEHCPGGRG